MSNPETPPIELDETTDLTEDETDGGPDPLAPDEEGLVPPYSTSKYLKASRAAEGCDNFAARVQAVCWDLDAQYSDQMRRKVALNDAVNEGIRVDKNLTVSTSRVKDDDLVTAVTIIRDEEATTPPVEEPQPDPHVG